MKNRPKIDLQYGLDNDPSSMRKKFDAILCGDLEEDRIRLLMEILHDEVEMVLDGVSSAKKDCGCELGLVTICNKHALS